MKFNKNRLSCWYKQDLYLTAKRKNEAKLKLSKWRNLISISLFQYSEHTMESSVFVNNNLKRKQQ